MHRTRVRRRSLFGFPTPTESRAGGVHQDDEEVRASPPAGHLFDGLIWALTGIVAARAADRLLLHAAALCPRRRGDRSHWPDGLGQGHAGCWAARPRLGVPERQDRVRRADENCDRRAATTTVSSGPVHVESDRRRERWCGRHATRRRSVRGVGSGTSGRPPDTPAGSSPRRVAVGDSWVTHVLLSTTMLARDWAATIGRALELEAAGLEQRPVPAAVAVARSTVRVWVSQFAVVAEKVRGVWCGGRCGSILAWSGSNRPAAASATRSRRSARPRRGCRPARDRLPVDVHDGRDRRAAACNATSPGPWMG